MARPTKYKKEMCDKVVPFMAQGYSQKALAGHLEISEDTLYAWIKEHPEFSESVKDGSTQSAIWWEKVGMTGMVGKIAGFNATTWIFNMKNRHGWTDKTDVNHGGQSDNPIAYTNIQRAIIDPQNTDS